MLSFTIRLSTGTKWTITLEEGATVATTTVLQVKEHLMTLKDQHEYLNDATIDTIRLIFKGRILENERVLSDYQIVPDATLFLVKSANRSNASPATPSNTTTASSAPRPAPAVPPVPPVASVTSTPPLFNPWGASGFGGAPPSLDSMMNHPPSQEQMNQVLNNPMIQSMLDSNPDFLRNMLQSQMQNNPQLRQMMESNPALAQMMNDPAALDQVMQMMRNPAAFQQVLRQQDLALSQLENMPGGMAALSSMYQQYQQPLEESMIGGGSSNTSHASNTNGNRNGEGSMAGASGQAMPNPWGNASSSRSTNSSRIRPANPMMNPWANMAAMANNNGSNNQGGEPDLFSPFGGLGAMSAPGMAPSPEQRQAVLQMMENPAVQNMMQQAIQQNPEMFRQALLAQNPMMEQMFRGNPAMLDHMMQQMMNPETLRAMFQMQDQLQGLNLGQAGYQPDSLNFSNLLGGVAPAAEQRPPAERYAVQLRSLYDMGFDDEQRNLQALEQVHGNLNRAVDYLLTMPLSSTPPSASAPTNNSTTSDTGAPSEPKDADDKKND
ncbi:ubiquilin [Fistulifera solaris]|uniref:Ubiquilin n=1 Tax=Fistulifera solaris TaxID=1519565 RepID=A0A1Z5JCJ3_FISSO|nr:ubiquilin [Fistulifera solaris]|eukprot:GAX11723.1 ubiquilin [Fistulifera solaris]